MLIFVFFFFQAEDGIRAADVTGVQTCALPISIDIERDDRYAGGSSYTPSELVRVAMDGLFFQTTKLLRWIVYAGFAVALAGVVLAALVLYNYALRDPPTGWTSLAVLL